MGFEISDSVMGIVKKRRKKIGEQPKMKKNFKMSTSRLKIPLRNSVKKKKIGFKGSQKRRKI